MAMTKWVVHVRRDPEAMRVAILRNQGCIHRLTEKTMVVYDLDLKVLRPLARKHGALIKAAS